MLYNHLFVPKSSCMKEQIEISVGNKFNKDDVTSSHEVSVLPKETENRISLIDTRWQHQQQCSEVQFRDETTMKVL